MIDKAKKFFQDNNMYAMVSNLGDRVKYYEYILMVDDIKKNENLKLTKTERPLLAHIMNYIYINGSIDGNKKKFDEMIDYLVHNGAIANKKLYLTHKNNLQEKGCIKKLSGKYRLSVSDGILKLLDKDSVTISVFLKNITEIGA